jgi:uncharacterized membrane protein YhdT
MRSVFRQADKEAFITLLLYLFFFIWWTLFAFGLGSGDPEEYSYIMGLPAWFFCSCILGYPIITFMLWYVIRHFFKDIPLDEESRSGDSDKNPPELQGSSHS